MKATRSRRGFLLTLTLASCASYATDLIYTPINPNFGGNPLNGPMLLNNAQAQDTNKDPDAKSSIKDRSSRGSSQKSALQQFNDSLQRMILSRISSAVSGGIINSQGELIPGTVETTDFTIVITDLGGGILQISTTDKNTGETTTFSVDNNL